jgi:PhnB protein
VGSDAEANVPTAPWGDAFGMLTDRFGTSWMLNIAAAQA